MALACSGAPASAATGVRVGEAPELPAGASFAGSVEPTAAVPAPVRVSRAHFGGVRTGKPRLTFSLAAREGATLTTLTVGVPPALEVAAKPATLAKGIVVRGPSGARLKFTATSTPGTLRIRLRAPQPSVKLKVGFPALATTPKLIAHIRAGRTHKLGLVVTTGESGGKGTRLPLTVGV
jgi:hypothetical protein